MQQKTKDKLLLCLQEMQYVRDIINLQCADEHTSRMLALYVAMRMDDFVHMVPQYPASDPKTTYIDEAKQEYQVKLEETRNKLGAHFQTIYVDTDGSQRMKDYIERNKTFTSFDCSTINSIVEDAIIVYQIATQTESTPPALASICDSDKDIIRDACKETYRDDSIRQYNDILNLSRPNGVSGLFTSKGHQKAQQILSVSMLINDILKFYEKTYSDTGLKRIFKRMLVCWVVNYYDNLVSRPVDPSAPQYDPGLDSILEEQFDNVVTEDVKNAIASKYTAMKQLKDNDAIVSSARDVRNRSCAHFDGASDLSTLNSIIDNYDESVLISRYALWVSSFEEVLKCHVTLGPLLSNGNIFFDALHRDGTTNTFYGEKILETSNANLTYSIAVYDAMEAIKDHNEKYNLAIAKLAYVLYQASGDEYQEFKTLLTKKFCNSITNEELADYSRLLYNAKQGSSQINQSFIISLWDLAKHCNPKIHRFFLWPLVGSAVYDSLGNLQRVIDQLVSSKEIFHKAYGVLLLFKAEVDEQHNPLVQNQNPDVSDKLSQTIHSIFKTYLERFAIWLVMNMHLRFDQSFICVAKWKKYNVYFDTELTNSFEDYCKSITLSKSMKLELEQLLEHKRYIQLLWYFIKLSQESSIDVQTFKSIVENTLAIGANDNYEIANYALCYEEIGWIVDARNMLLNLIKENQMQYQHLLTYCKFLSRHQEYSEEYKERRKFLETNFNLGARELEYLDQRSK